MRRYWSFLLLHFVGTAMGLAFLVQLRLHGGAMFAIQWWPILITGVLFASACCLQPELPTALVAAPGVKESRYLRRRPSDLSLKTATLVGFGLSPFWGWRTSAASLSYGLLRYFSLLEGVAMLTMFASALYFALHLRVLCVCIGGSERAVRRWTLAARGLLYFVLVPVFAVFLGSLKLGRELFQATPHNWQYLAQMLEYYFTLPFYSGIGSAIIWLGLGMLAWQVTCSFHLLLNFDEFLDAREIAVENAVSPETVLPAEQETTEND